MKLRAEMTKTEQERVRAGIKNRGEARPILERRAESIRQAQTGAMANKNPNEMIPASDRLAFA
jgi:hypothetical protein